MIAAACLCALLAAAPVPSAGLAIENATLADPVREEQLPGRTVVISDGRIAAIGKTGEMDLSAVERRIDGSGWFLIPGLTDTHVHLDELNDTALTLMAIHGVTLVREMGGDILRTRRVEARIHDGLLVGPDIRIAGPILESRDWMLRVREVIGEPFRNRVPVGGPAEAADAVELIAPLGMNHLKIRTVANLPTFQGIAATAREHGLPLVGHYEGGFPLTAALEAGQHSIEHAPLMLFLEGGLDEPAMRELARTAANSGAYFTPTWVAMANRRMSVDELRDRLRGDDPRLATISDGLRAEWDRQIDERAREGGGGLDWPTLTAQARTFLRVAHEEGMPMLTGSDLTVGMVFPGSAIHDELEHMVEYVGMTPREALLCSTANGPRALGLDDRGRVEVGMRADLVLLGADPFADIGAVRDIRGVVLAGRYLDADALADLRDWVTTNRNVDFGSRAGRAELEMRYAAGPNRADAELLARYLFALGDYADADVWFARYAVLGGDPLLAHLGRFNAVLNALLMERGAKCEDLVEVAQGYVADRPDAAARVQALLREGDALIGQDGCRPALTSLVADLEAAGDDGLDAAERLNRDRFLMGYHARVDKNGDLALRYRERTLPAGWREDATELNRTAYWLFQNGIALDAAERLARESIARAAQPKDKASGLNTLAEIENLRGDPAAALTTIREALATFDNDYFRKQEQRFAELAGAQPK